MKKIYRHEPQMLIKPVLVLVLILLHCGVLRSQIDPVTEEATATDYFTDKGFGNPLGYIQLPSGEYYKGVTYIAFQGPHEDAYVCAYDHRTQRWTGPVLAGVSMMGKTPDPLDNSEVDNHGRPALVVDREGYIHLVFGGHGGYAEFGENHFGKRGKGKQTHVVSKRPEDISEWEELDNISPFGTYNQLVKMDNGDIYLFYRHGSHRSDWVYQKSTDNGRTFEGEVSVLKCNLLPDGITSTAWYAIFTRGAENTISVVYVYHACASPGHSKLRENVYFMRMNCADASWESASGEKLVVPVTKEYADTKTRLLDSKGVRCNPGICRYDPEGNLHLIYRYQQQQYRYTRWVDGSWQEPVRIALPSLRGQFADLIPHSLDDIDVLIAADQEGGGGEISWWQSTDAGYSWTRGERIFASERVEYCTSTRIRNNHPYAMFGFFAKDPASTHLYRKIYLWGENGFVQRRW